ncbi:MAG: tetratricopeptide repeat protein [Isosphaeraceae bacterium]
MSEVRSRRRFQSLRSVWRAWIWVVILAPVTFFDEPLAPQAAPPRSHSKADDRLAEAKSLSAEVVRLYGQGRYREATAKARRALAIRERVLGKHHPDTAACLDNLAALLKAQGDYAVKLRRTRFWAHLLYDRIVHSGYKRPCHGRHACSPSSSLRVG